VLRSWTYRSRTSHVLVVNQSPAGRSHTGKVMHATSCLLAHENVRGQYSPRMDFLILSTFVHVESTHVHVRTL